MTAPDPSLTRRQAREIDRRAIEQYGLSGLVLMENAGRSCVDLLCRLGIAGPVAICCGKGNNAGDGFVMARHLELRGHEVKTLLWSDPDQLRGDAEVNFRILEKSGAKIVRFAGQAGGNKNDIAQLQQELAEVDWIVDALLGTGAQGDPRPPLDEVIRQMNEQPAHKLAVDLPSGLDCDSGAAGVPTFRADQTCTFVAAKVGFATDEAKTYLGQVHLMDIGAPRCLVDEILEEGKL